MRALLCQGHSALLENALNATTRDVYQDTSSLGVCDVAIAIHTQARNSSDLVNDTRLAQLHIYRGVAHFHFRDLVSATNDVNKALRFAKGLVEALELQHRIDSHIKAEAKRDYYKTLNIAKNATLKEIKKAYRSLAKKFHPDKANQNNMTRSEAEDKFRELAEANEVLRNTDLREKHDKGEDVSQAAQQGSKYSYDKRSVNPDGSVRGWMEADGEKVMMHFTIGADGQLHFGVKANETHYGCELEHSCLAWSDDEEEEHRRPRRIATASHRSSQPGNNGTATQVVNIFDLITLHLQFHVVAAAPAAARGEGGETDKFQSKPGCVGCACDVGWSSGWHGMTWEGIRFPPHNISEGDLFVYEMLWEKDTATSGRVAVDLINDKKVTLGEAGGVDQHGVCAHAHADLSQLEITEKWIVRVVPLPSTWVGTALQKVMFACEAGGTGQVSAAVRNLRILNRDKNLKIRILSDRKAPGAFM